MVRPRSRLCSPLNSLTASHVLFLCDQRNVYEFGIILDEDNNINSNNRRGIVVQTYLHFKPIHLCLKDFGRIFEQ